MNRESLSQLLKQFRLGEFELDEVLERLPTYAAPATQQTSDAHIDLDRRSRCGFPEVVYGEGKTTETLIEIFDALQQNGQACLATRICPEQAEGVMRRFPDAVHNSIARTIRWEEKSSTEKSPLGKVAVMTAGTSDRPVAEEAAETLKWMNCGVEQVVDVGVAGPHRLPEHRHRFANADAIVVVAGMEGALPSVVGGWVNCPVIAVPTSVGYGASFGGVAALLGMLNSCASNVVVVNIDAGFKAGYVAGLIAHRSNAKSNSSQKSN